MSQKLEEKASEAGGDRNQRRGQGVSEEDKHRVAFEVAQVVDNYFSSSEGPKDRSLPSALVFTGVMRVPS